MELSILDFIQQYLNFNFLDPFLRVMTYSGNHGLIFIVFSVILLINKKTRKIGIYCLASLAIGALITNVSLKPLFARTRPYEYSNIMLKIIKPTDYSFPSGHTTAAFAVAFVLLKTRYSIKNHKIYLYFLVFAILMAYSRLYFYVHFPSDVLAAVVIGYIASILAKYLIDKLHDKLSTSLNNK